MKTITSILAVLITMTFLSFTADSVTDTGAMPSVSAKCAVVLNADTGRVLMEKNAYSRHAMASTTKIMTALVTLESGDLDLPFTVDSMAIRVEGTSMGLREGDVVTRRALCTGMLLPSGNDAANAAAVNIAGSLSAFADMMNRRAAQIGMKDTHFVTPSGLDAEGHYTTAYDMALLAREALANAEFRAICGMQSARVEFGSPLSVHTLYNSNKLLRMYDGCIGVKTGFTDNARRCLVSAAERGGCTLIAVTLDAPDDWNDHRKMLDGGFAMIKPYNVRLNSFAVDVIGGETGSVSVSPASDVILGMTEGESRRVSVKYSIPPFVYADIARDDVVGYADIFLDGELLGRVPMTAAESVSRIVPELTLWQRIIHLFT